ncbi:MAG: CapA family protein, partial [Chloroflexi bacterium]|nr:CapA family protein [Chloroflexota bacterium]
MGCGSTQVALPTAVSPIILPPPSPTPVFESTESVTLSSTATPMAALPITLSAAPGVPAELVGMAQSLANRLPNQFVWLDSAPADVLLTLNEGQRLASWVYVVAAPFATVEDGVTLPELVTSWQATVPSPWKIFAPIELAAWQTAVFHTPQQNVTFLANVAQMGERAWAERPSLLILPFHQLTPNLKLLTLDGHSPLSPQFDAAAYPLTISLNVVGEKTAVDKFLTVWDGPATNWDVNKLTRVAMSGVTALTRATAYQMEIGGILTPGQAVRPVLQTADIAHISNEVSFTPECPYPNPVGGTTFCSRESYFELLTFLGIDVVELTGNHLNDWGTDGLLHSLDMYTAANMQTFGGGANGETAQQPAIFSHNGNKIAFVGCNPVG